MTSVGVGTSADARPAVTVSPTGRGIVVGGSF